MDDAAKLVRFETTLRAIADGTITHDSWHGYCGAEPCSCAADAAQAALDEAAGKAPETPHTCLTCGGTRFVEPIGGHDDDGPGDPCPDCTPGMRKAGRSA